MNTIEKTNKDDMVKLSWQTNYHLRLPLNSDLFIFDKGVVTLLTNYLASNYIKIDIAHSQVSGTTSVSQGQCANVPKDILARIFRIEDTGDFANKRIFSKVLFQNDVEEHMKNEVLQLVESFNKKSRYTYHPTQIEQFDLTLKCDKN